jgi:hypothetical protein
MTIFDGCVGSGRGGGRAYFDRGSYTSRGGGRGSVNDYTSYIKPPCAIAAAAAANSTKIVEYNAGTASNVSTRESHNSSDRGGREGGRFGLRRDQYWLRTPAPCECEVLVGRIAAII